MACLCLILCRLGPAATVWGAPGENSLDLLLMPPGPRESAMAGAGSALAEGLFGASLNPAGLSGLARQEAVFQHSSHFQGISYENLGYALPTSRWGAFGMGLQTADYGSIQGYDATGAKTGNVAAWDRMISFRYARAARPGIAVGAGAGFIQEKLGGDAAQALSFDLGLQARPWESGRLSGLAIGAGVRNLGLGPRFASRSESLPSAVAAGVGYRALQDSLALALDGVKTGGEKFQLRFGVEIWMKDAAAVRAGYATGSSLGGGWTAGAGFKFMDFQLDYSLSGFGDLGVSNRVSLTYRFGSLAEAYYSRGMAKMHEGRYAEAIMEFDKAVTLDPKHERSLLRIREAHRKLREKLLRRAE